MGTLFVVGTPIGNLGDLSPRARQVLEDADLVVAEDTRRIGRLAHLAGFHLREIRALQGAGRLRDEEFVARVGAGIVALVSDAGMPGVSDPGGRLVGLAYEHGIEVRVVPGPSVLAAVLALWPAELEGAVFVGFLPRQGRARDEALTALLESRWPTVVLESPKRVAHTLEELAARAPWRRALVVSELTKVHERVRLGTVVELATDLRDAPLRGEWAFVIDGGQRGSPVPGDRLSAAREVAATSLSVKEGAALLARLGVMGAREAYAALVALRSGQDGSLDSTT